MNTEWKMTEFKVEFETYGDYKNTYVGYVKFQNAEKEAFTFKLRDGMIQPFINLICGELALSANSLVERLQISLGLKAAPVQQTTSPAQNVPQNNIVEEVAARFVRG
jgi:hypothetical protein